MPAAFLAPWKARDLPREIGPEAVIDALQDRMAAENIECGLCHEGLVGPPPGDGWD